MEVPGKSKKLKSSKRQVIPSDHSYAFPLTHYPPKQGIPLSQWATEYYSENYTAFTVFSSCFLTCPLTWLTPGTVGRVSVCEGKHSRTLTVFTPEWCPLPPMPIPLPTPSLSEVTLPGANLLVSTVLQWDESPLNPLTFTQARSFTNGSIHPCYLLCFHCSVLLPNASQTITLYPDTQLHCRVNKVVSFFFFSCHQNIRDTITLW